MATEALKSAQITNADANPAVLNPAYQAGGWLRTHRGYVTAVLAASQTGSTYRFVRIKSNDMVKRVILDAESLGTGAAMDIGLYQTAANGGAVVDADFFASAIAMAAAQSNIDVTRESGVLTLPNFEKRVWEALGLTQDPQREYDVVATITTDTTVAGKMVLTVDVVGGN